MTKSSLIVLTAIVTVSGCMNTDPGGRTSMPSPATLRQVHSEAELEGFIKAGLKQAYNTSTYDTVGVMADQSTTLENEPVSDTNTIEPGVDEADWITVKDGNLHILQKPDIHYWSFFAEEGDWDYDPVDSPARIHTIAIDSAPSQNRLSRYELNNALYWVDGLYSRDQQLIVLGAKSKPHEDWGNPWYWRHGRLSVEAIDVSNPTEPTQQWSIAMDGYLVDSRRIDDRLYLVSRFSPHLPGLDYAWNDEERQANDSVIEQAGVNDFLPNLTWTIGSVTTTVQLSGSGCYIPDSAEWAGYGFPTLTHLTVIDLNSPGEHQTRCTVAPVSRLYQNDSAIYLIENQHVERTNNQVHRFALNQQAPTYTGSVQFAGDLGWNQPEFRLREQDDVLTLVTTEGIDQHKVHTYRVNDNGFTPLATLPNTKRPERIGKPGETIRSARISQDKVEIVTFEQIDPLYLIDLTNPADPFIANQLEEPGFSSYLHSISDNLTVGIGRSGDENGNIEGIKISLYESDLDGELINLANATLPDYDSSYTPAAWEHHAYTGLNYEAQGIYRFVIPAVVTNYRHTDYEQTEGYLTFEVNLAAKTWKHTWVPIEGSVNNWNNSRNARSIIQGDAVHGVWGNQLISWPWHNPEAKETLLLEPGSSPSDG